MKNHTLINKTHRIIVEEIEGSRETEGDERLVQVLSTVVEVTHIGKCIIPEREKEKKNQITRPKRRSSDTF